MAARLVLCLQSKAPGEGDAASTLGDMLGDLSARSAVRGGRIVAWQVDGVAFSFPVEALPDLTDMLPEPPCTEFGMGLAVAACCGLTTPLATLTNASSPSRLMTTL